MGTSVRIRKVGRAWMCARARALVCVCVRVVFFVVDDVLLWFVIAVFYLHVKDLKHWCT